MTMSLWNSIPTAWRKGLSSCKTEIEEIDGLLAQSEASGNLAPARELIFAALAVAPTEVSVVILGQDPYPKPGHAIGLAFAVPVDTHPIPGSLRNIFNEVQSDTGRKSTADCSLESWVNQGVLLLNTSLTTEQGVRAAHADWPWQSVVDALLRHVVAVNPDVVAVLWGNQAKQFAGLFGITIESAHPSPLSANRGFLGSKPFSKVNEVLAATQKPVISW